MHLSLKSLNSPKSLKSLKYLKSLKPRKDTDVTAAATHEHSLAPHQVEFGHSLALHHVEFGHRRQHHLCRCDCRVGFSGRVTVESLYALGQIEFVLMVGVASGVSLRPRADRDG